MILILIDTVELQELVIVQAICLQAFAAQQGITGFADSHALMPGQFAAGMGWSMWPVT